MNECRTCGGPSVNDRAKRRHRTPQQESVPATRAASLNRRRRSASRGVARCAGTGGAGGNSLPCIHARLFLRPVQQKPAPPNVHGSRCGLCVSAGTRRDHQQPNQPNGLFQIILLVSTLFFNSTILSSLFSSHDFGQSLSVHR